MLLSHILLAANPGPPFLPVLVGSVCHDDELRVKVNTKAVTVLSACLFVDLVAADWPHCTNLVNKEASIPVSVGLLHLGLFSLDDKQCVGTSFSKPGETFGLSWLRVRVRLVISTAQPLIECKRKPQLWWFLMSNQYHILSNYWNGGSAGGGLMNYEIWGHYSCLTFYGPKQYIISFLKNVKSFKWNDWLKNELFV